MIQFSINNEKCNKCYKCIDVCKNSTVLARSDSGFPEYKDKFMCIFCGHCFAICPQKAISPHPVAPEWDSFYYAEPMDMPEGKPSKFPLEDLLFGTRSERDFNDRHISTDTVKKILDAMIRASSAGNEQNRNYYIFHGRDKVRMLEKAASRELYKMTEALKNPLFAKFFEFLSEKQVNKKYRQVNDILMKAGKKERKRMFKRATKKLEERGEAKLFYNAPAAIVVTSNTNTGQMHKKFYKADVAISVTIGTIVARNEGLSSCWMGLAEIAMNKNKQIKKQFHIPGNERVDGILALGYSDTGWKQIPPRGPVKTVWV